MAHLGEFGRAVADYDAEQDGVVEPDTFTFYGEAFEVPPLLSDLPLMRFCAAIQEGQQQTADADAVLARSQAARAKAATDEQIDRADREERRALEMAEGAGTKMAGAAYTFIAKSLGEEQWPRFEQVAEKHGADREELMGLAAQIYAAAGARPTRKPSLSTPGRSSTGDGSTAGSGSPVETGGPSLPGTASVIPLSPAAQQMADFRAEMRPVGELLASGG